MNSPEHADEADDIVYVASEEASRFVSSVLHRYGVSSGQASTVAQCLVRANLRGVDSHGLFLLPLYVRRLREGLINASPRLSIEASSPVVARIDGDNGLGHVVATRAMEHAISTAERYGVGIVGAWNSTHFGMAANYILQAIDADCVSLVFTNSSPAMPPHGGREAIFGTNPIAAGAPGNPTPFVLDMSPAVVARGKIRRAGRRGETIPEGYGLDRNGSPTTDPAEVLSGGVVLPIGGPKGSGLAMLMDIMAGVITGAGFAGSVRSQNDDFSTHQNVGHFFLALKSDVWLGRENYGARMTSFVQTVNGTRPAIGHNECLLPGQPESVTEKLRQATGIPYSRYEIEVLGEMAESAGVPPLATNRRPLGN